MGVSWVREGEELIKSRLGRDKTVCDCRKKVRKMIRSRILRGIWRIVQGKVKRFGHRLRCSSGIYLHFGVSVVRPCLDTANSRHAKPAYTSRTPTETEQTSSSREADRSRRSSQWPPWHQAGNISNCLNSQVILQTPIRHGRTTGAGMQVCWLRSKLFVEPSRRLVTDSHAAVAPTKKPLPNISTGGGVTATSSTVTVGAFLSSST